MSEMRVGVRDLKARLSKYLRQVSQGQTVIITDHGRPVGRLSPVDQPLDERLKALQDAGLVTWNGQKLKPVTPAAVNRSERQVSDILVEMRE
jgi:prevent-host-death family protein